MDAPASLIVKVVAASFASAFAAAVSPDGHQLPGVHAGPGEMAVATDIVINEEPVAGICCDGVVALDSPSSPRVRLIPDFIKRT
mmetsp:Transcript_21150/g.68429  ORF Transcript_21150/g.68429 Transcript_21150/m.68429 type:complete len:84 (+) Transcript_21150:687-938(+)